MSTNLDHPIDISDWMSQAEAARSRQVSKQAISKLVRNGRIRSIKIGGHILVNRADVEAFEPKPAGRPRIAKEPK